jgi:hypothetical protein
VTAPEPGWATGRRAPLNWLDVPLTVSLGWSCGCTTRPTGGVTNADAARPGVVRICDHCDEFAVLTRVTTRLADPSGDTVAQLLYADRDADLTPDFAREIAGRQAAERGAER